MKITEEALTESTKELFADGKDAVLLWKNVDTFLTNNTEENVLIKLLLCGTLNTERLLGFIHGYLCYQYMLKKNEISVLNDMLNK